MLKSDLKTGMVVEYRNTIRFLVLNGDLKSRYDGKQELLFIAPNQYDLGSNFDEGLKAKNGMEHDIIKVYKPKISSLFTTIDDLNESDCIWQRKSDRQKQLEQEIESLELQLKAKKDELMEVQW